MNMSYWADENLTANQIKIRAKEFADRHKNSHYEKGETQTFYDDFWRILGRDRLQYAQYEREIKRNDSNGFIDVFMPKWLIIEQKSEGRSLDRALSQAEEYCVNIDEHSEPRYILACDFQTFHLVDRKERKEYNFELSDLPNNIQHFDFIRGIEHDEIVDEDPVNIHATELLGKIFELLKRYNYQDKHVVTFLTRIIYCLFADDTGIFEPPNILQKYIKDRTSSDGSDLGSTLQEIFQTLNTPIEKRPSNLRQEISIFPFINGKIFDGNMPITSFDAEMRDLLIEACEFDWSKVSPVIFGSLFETVMSDEERHSSGAHYTERKNIMKVIKPLFLDKLFDEFKQINQIRTRQRKQALEQFQEKLSKLKFLDPASGSGNFLIVTYQELRRLENQIIFELHDQRTQLLDISHLSKISINQFYGIEIKEYSAQISQISLWMMEHLMNQELAERFGQVFIDIPLKTHPNIHNKDSLEIDWNDVLPNNECSFILGNPPYLGANNYSNPDHRSKKEQIKRIADIGESGGVLDYVTGWFIKAGQYCTDSIKLGFVSTNSIVQGQQVGHLWDILFDRYNFEINFAHKDFQWESEGRGRATVTVVIIGLSKNHQESKRLFSIKNGKSEEENPEYISPYLIGNNTKLPIVKKSRSRLNNLPTIRKGSQPRDGGNYIFTHNEKSDFLAQEPLAERFLRPYVGADEFLGNTDYRWILTLQNILPNELRQMPEIKRRVEKVKSFRSGSTSAETRALDPKEFYENVIPTNPFLIIPATTSERREYVPFGYLQPPIVPSNAVYIIENASLGLFGLLSSKMHMLWLRVIGGKLESRLRYSVDIVYNTFPTPGTDLQTLEKKVSEVIKYRENYSGETLADLYDPDIMPSELKNAHLELDYAVEQLYRSEDFNTDDERIAFLLSKYEEQN